MSWHASAFFVDRDITDEIPMALAEMGFEGVTREQQTVDRDEVTHMWFDGVGVAYDRGWTMVSNARDMFGGAVLGDANEPPFECIWPDRVERNLAQLSLGGRAYGFILIGSVGCWGFTLHVDGKRHRSRYRHHGKLWFDEGEPSDIELTAFAEARQERDNFRRSLGVPASLIESKSEAWFEDDEGLILALTSALCPLFNTDIQYQVYSYERFDE